jgi:tetratricopeptide (TPR) repeat protein
MRLDAQARRSAYYFVAGCALAALILVSREDFVTHALQDAHIAITGSSTVARLYADESFDATGSHGYNIGRANSLYTRAALLNPHEPLVAYQRGRIAFLEGRFADAERLFSQEIETSQFPPPAVYYMRALNRAFREDFLGAARDYEIYFSKTPAGWASINDYSWVLIQLGLYSAAEEALRWGIDGWPDNPWLLNSMASALYEQKKYSEAKKYVELAQQEVRHITNMEWRIAYPGNDPQMAPQAIEEFARAVGENRTKVSEALAK